MKFRFDFVTNSSSESFFCIGNRFSDGTSEYMDDEENFFPGYNNDWPVSQGENGLVSDWGKKIKTTKDLCIVLLLSALHAGYFDIPFDIFSELFSLIVGESDFSTFIERIMSFETTVYKNNDYYDEEEEEEEKEKANAKPNEENDLEDDTLFGDYYEFSDLENIDPENDDLFNIIEKIYDIFGDGIDSCDFNEKRLIYLKKLYSKGYSISDFSTIEIHETCNDWGEFLPYEERLYKDPYPFGTKTYKSNDFPQMTKEDPLFIKECTRWTDFMKEVHGVSGIDDIFPEDALTKGQYTYLAGYSFSNTRHKSSFYYPNGINICLNSFCSKGEIPDNMFFEAEEKETHINIGSLLIPEGIRRIGKNGFRNCEIKSVVFPNGLTKIGAFAFDGCMCAIPKIPDTVKKIGTTFVWELFKYAVDHKILVTEENEIFRVLECEVDNHDTRYLEILAKNGYLPKRFPNYPITDLIDKAVRIGFERFIDILLNAGLELDYSDVAHYIHNGTLETLYPLFDRGLKIDPSAYDNLITYASEHGKPEYTAWLLNRKNKTAQEKDAIEK